MIENLEIKLPSKKREREITFRDLKEGEIVKTQNGGIAICLESNGGDLLWLRYPERDVVNGGTFDRMPMLLDGDEFEDDELRVEGVLPKGTRVVVTFIAE